MSDTFTGHPDLTSARVGQSDTERDELRAALARCMRFIRTIPDDEARLPVPDGWRAELRAIKREVKI